MKLTPEEQTMMELLDYSAPTGLHPNELRWRLFAAKLRGENKVLSSALREFCERVERGEIKSVRTYKKFKELLGEPIE